MLSDYNGIKLETNLKKISGKSANVWKLTLLSHPLVKKEIRK